MAKIISPFIKYCSTIGVVPSTYEENLTYIECLNFLIKFLNDTVIPTYNDLDTAFNNLSADNAQFKKDMTEAFNTLKSYVDNYFDNLDVQEEINNKLDAMVEDGTLEEIISHYINLQFKKYDTVAAMLADTELVAGTLIKTLNFRAGDGVINEYIVVDTEAEASLDLLTINGTIKAQLLYPDGSISPDMLGAYGDGSHDDISYITFAIAKSKTAGLNLVFNTNKIYGISEPISITSETYLDFNNATLKALEAMTTMIDVDYTDFNGAIKNLRMDCHGLAEKAMNFTGNRKFEVTSINIWDIKTIGIQINSGYEIRFNDITMNTDGTVYTDTAGFVVDTSDLEFDNIFMREIKRAFVLNSSVSSHFSNIHAWTISSSNFVGSKMFDINTTADADLYISNVYCDTYQYFLYYTTANAPRISVVNASYRVNPTTAGTTNSYLFHVQGTQQYDRLMITGSTFIGMGITGTPTTSVADGTITFIPRTTNVQFINMIVPTISLSDVSGSVSAITNNVTVDGQYVTISGVFTASTTGSAITFAPIGKLPTAFIMPKNGMIVSGAMVADSRWDWASASSVYAYLDTSSNGLQVRIPGRTAGSTDYIFLDITYPRRPIV